MSNEHATHGVISGRMQFAKSLSEYHMLLKVRVSGGYFLFFSSHAKHEPSRVNHPL